MIFADDLTGTGLIFDLANFFAVGNLTEAALRAGFALNLAAGFKATLAAGLAETDFVATFTAGFATIFAAGFTATFAALATVFFSAAFLATDFFDLQLQFQFFI